MSLHLITFGIDKTTGMLRNIEDVPSGLACNCVCPKCGSLLEAHKGKEHRHRYHFQHHSIAECKGAFESQLHLLSKAIIEDNKMLMLPVYAGRFCAYPQKQQSFTEVFKECTQGDLQPDCLCKYMDETGVEQTLWVEILYTHAVDEDKARKIQERHVACVEVDVGQLFKDAETIDKEVLTDFLLNSPNNRQWINNPQGDELVLAEADEIRKQESIVSFLKEYSNFEVRIGRFQSLIYCLFSTGYNLSQRDYNSIYVFVKKYQQSYHSLAPVIQQRYISAVQVLFCHLVVTTHPNNVQRTRSLVEYCFDRKSIIDNFGQRVNFVVELGAIQYRPQSMTNIRHSQPKYVLQQGRFVRKRRL